MARGRVDFEKLYVEYSVNFLRWTEQPDARRNVCILQHDECYIRFSYNYSYLYLW